MRTAEAIRASQLKDQFCETTRVVRRNLIIASSAAILLDLPDIKLDAFLGLDLSTGQAAPLAIGAVAFIAAYEFVSFAIYATIDHARWRIEPGTILLNDSGVTMRQVEVLATDSRSYLGELADRWAEIPAKQEIDRMRAFADQCLDAITQYRDAVKAHNLKLARHNVLQLVRVYLLDWAVPLVIGATAIISNWREMERVLAAIYSQLSSGAF